MDVVMSSVMATVMNLCLMEFPQSFCEKGSLTPCPVRARLHEVTQLMQGGAGMCTYVRMTPLPLDFVWLLVH